MYLDFDFSSIIRLYSRISLQLQIVIDSMFSRLMYRSPAESSAIYSDSDTMDALKLYNDYKSEFMT